MDGSASVVELDFFSMKEGSNGPHSSVKKPPIFERRRSFRDIQSVISKMNPEIVKSVIANGCVGSCSSQTRPYNYSVPSPLYEAGSENPKLPVCDPILRLSNNRLHGQQKMNAAEPAAPLTIFYNGMVAVFDVSPDKAHNILKIAVESDSKITEPHESLCESPDGDLPITRKNSLQRFLEKRKERMIEVSPY